MAKSFGPTQAIRSATFDLLPGEIHAVVGENGSGKSTLVKLLAGVHQPDGGSLVVSGTPRPGGLRNPRAALGAGISTVFQEVLVVEGRSVLDNVWLGNEGFLRATISDAAKRAQAAQQLQMLLGYPPPLDAPAGMLSLSDRQACCIARSLVREPRVLLLDEATSALDVATRGRLFDHLRRMAAGGAGVVFISHRMDEIDELADRVTVMRSGETVATLARQDATTDRLVELMTGADHLTAGVGAPSAREAAAAAGQTPIVLRTRDLRLRPGGRPIDLDLREGELVGLAGLEGHGQDAFLRALWGGGSAGGGEVEREGAPITSPRQAARLGVAYVPRERRAESLLASKSILENFAVATLGRDAAGGLLWPARSRRRFAEYTERLRIVLGDPGDPITSLSGGNQQKVVIARWLAAGPRILLLNDPTRGIDLGAKRDVYRLLRELAAGGVSVVMLSTEVDEHVELMDRVLVFREHELAAELAREGLSRHTLVSTFFGGTVHA